MESEIITSNKFTASAWNRQQIKFAAGSEIIMKTESLSTQNSSSKNNSPLTQGIVSKRNPLYVQKSPTETESQPNQKSSEIKNSRLTHGIVSKHNSLLVIMF